METEVRVVKPQAKEPLKVPEDEGGKSKAETFSRAFEESTVLPAP